MSSDEAGDGELGRAGEGGAVFLGEEVMTTCEGLFKERAIKAEVNSSVAD